MTFGDNAGAVREFNGAVDDKRRGKGQREDTEGSIKLVMWCLNLSSPLCSCSIISPLRAARFPRVVVWRGSSKIPSSLQSGDTAPMC